MKPRFSILTLLAWLMSLAASHFMNASASAQEVVVSFTFVDGQYHASVSEETLKVLPLWKPGEDEPPVSPRDALAAADRVFRASYDPKMHPDWTVRFSRLELARQYFSLDVEEYDGITWVWLAVYEASWKGLRFHSWNAEALSMGYDPAFVVPVLMNGEALTPVMSSDTPPTEAALRERAELVAPDDYPRRTGPWLYGGEGGEATITSQLLSQSPNWKLADEGPPVPFAKALAAATPVQQRWLIPHGEGWRIELENVSLRELQTNKWVWRFLFEEKFGGAFAGYPARVSVAVLMDGKAVEPVKVEPTK